MTYEMIPVANWSIQELFLTLSLPTSSLLRSGMLNFPLLHSLFVCFHLTTPTTITSPFPSPSPNIPQALHPPSPPPHSPFNLDHHLLAPVTYQFLTSLPRPESPLWERSHITSSFRGEGGSADDDVSYFSYGE